MKSLKHFLIEQQNLHLEHIDDLIFNEGVNGLRRAINFLRDLRDMLAGNAKTKVSATVKWDGAPAIIAGIDPRDEKFFVGKKGVFNKNPKVYKTQADVDADGRVHRLVPEAAQAWREMKTAAMPVPSTKAGMIMAWRLPQRSSVGET